MRIAIGLLCGALCLTGCIHRHQAAPARPIQSQPPKPVIEPDLRVTGQVEMVNPSARFVVLSFPPGPMPATDQHLDVYRQGVKIGEVKVSGPQQGSDTVADILSGDIQTNDGVREQQR